MTRRHPDTVSLRYLAAPAAVAGIGAGLAMAGVGAATRQGWLVALGLAAPAGYAAANLAASALSARTAPALTPAEARQLPIVYATMHGAWGLGFLRGLSRAERRAMPDSDGSMASRADQ